MPWWQGPCRCDICGYECRSVVEIGQGEDEPIVPLECAGCGNMTCNPTDEKGTIRDDDTDCFA
jgi:hypothetical protein